MARQRKMDKNFKAGPIQEQGGRWEVWRQDDNGNLFKMASGVALQRAQRIVRISSRKATSSIIGISWRSNTKESESSQCRTPVDPTAARYSQSTSYLFIFWHSTVGFTGYDRGS